NLIEAYKKAIPTSDPNFVMNQYGKILQPETESFYTDELINQAKGYSDTAIVVVSRISGENCGECPMTSKDYLSGEEDTTRTYLQLSKKEEDMLNIVEDNFSKVIVLLNTTNSMETGFLRNEKISAALYCGPTGLSGTESVANLLAGRKIEKDENGKEVTTLISPSGRLADTYSNNLALEPGFANKDVRNKSTTSGNLVYQEGMYFGYRWYETADKEGFFNGLPNGYDSAVVYPFGYGLSYTDFSWTINKVSLPEGSSLTKDSKIDIEVTVKNTGDYAGKDVVELYYSLPYYKGGIEKSAINLGAYAKTSVLQPNDSQVVTLSISAYEMASYDCYDKNENNHSGYELDAGNYELKFMKDAHHAKDMASPVLNYTVDSTININKDPITNYSVINRFTGDDGYAGISYDGANVGINATYLSRNDFVATFTDKQCGLPTDTDKINKAKIYKTGSNNTDDMPIFGEDNGLYLVTNKDGSRATGDQLKSRKDLAYNDELIDELLSDLDGEKWDKLLNQLSKEEARALVEKSGFGSAEMVTIGKTKTLDFDGPSGFNQNTQKIAEDMSSWTSYPCECVIGCTWNKTLANEFGQSIAFEASKSGLNGWYAPSVNLHRSSFYGRNYENYSEDPLISGDMAAATIMGAKSGGLYCYLKHLILSETGDNPKGVHTWITEQALRELFLKPFEIAVKAGANSIMSSLSCFGPVWSGANYDLVTEVIRNEWGFKGCVVTDWCNGDEIMNTNRGVLAGNDIWLNPMAQNYTPLDPNNSTEMYCAKLATRHNVFAYIDTYQYCRDFDDENNPYHVNAGVISSGDVYEWWIPTLIGIDCVFFITTIAMGIYTFVPWDTLRRKKEQN
ncbi:MAG: glycoside hydrolase family 3 N-terminal domain-containing protein, partial [Bacilli bacterium]